MPCAICVAMSIAHSVDGFENMSLCRYLCKLTPRHKLILLINFLNPKINLKHSLVNLKCYLITMAHLGGFKQTPYSKIRFECRVFLRLSTSSLKFFNCSESSFKFSSKSISFMAT